VAVADDAEAAHPSRATGIDKSVLTIAAPRRYRNRDHLRFVAQQPCLVCGRKPSDPHHLRRMQPTALGRKPSDEFAVPLCRVHHRAVHRTGDELAWWKTAGINPLVAARKLWKQTRMNEGRVRPDRTRQAADADTQAVASGSATRHRVTPAAPRIPDRCPPCPPTCSSSWGRRSSCFIPPAAPPLPTS
jgi:hypothetical protein